MTQRREPSGELVLAAQSAKGRESPVSLESDDLAAGDAASIGAGGSAPVGTANLPEGRIVGVEHDKIVGWAWDAARPYEPVYVELFIGSLLVGHGCADRFNIDLAKANRGNGMHRFELSLDRLPASPPPFTIRAVIADTDEELLPAIVLTTLEDAERLLSDNAYMGKLTGIVDGMLCGWVLNWHNPHEEPVLTLRDGDNRVLSRTVSGYTSAVIESGVTANAYRFELPLPGNILDGRQHALSVLVGAAGEELAGSPIMFGPSDVSTIGRSVATVFDQLQQLDRKLDSLQPGYDLSLLERTMTHRILDRVDMLLNIHRDGLERELAVLRRQVGELIAQFPQSEPDVIRPVAKVPAVADEPAPAAETFTLVSRSSPLVSYDLGAKPQSAKPFGGFKWSESVDRPGVSIADSGGIALDGVPSGPASLILDGTGAGDSLEFCGMVTAFQGRLLVGRVETDESGNWTLTGTTIEGAADAASAAGLAITYLPELSQPSGRLGLNAISVFRHGRAPEGTILSPPQSVVVYLGGEAPSSGWHAIEPGPRGGFCWMGAQADLAFRLRQTGVYRLTLPEVRPLVRDTMSKLQIALCGVPLKVQVSSTKKNPAVFSVQAEGRIPHQESGILAVRLSFPEGCIKSPTELGVNDDQRPLAFATRTIALTALES
ncbi:MAG TPA: hypothetical protein VII49_14245 [Rhizomicrobium sp.]